MTRALPGRLRRASTDDAPAVAVLVRAAYGKYVARIGREPKPMTVDYATAIADHPLWLLEEDGNLLGLIELIPAADHLLIENVAVDPARQGAGLGRALLAFAEAEAQHLGLAELRLYTNERFAENLALYARLGYGETGREPRSGTAIVHMAKRVGA